MNKTLLTMGMVVYNEEKHISEAIEGLLAQTYKDFILIISDNASTDRTQKICKYYAKRNKQIVYYKHEENMGASFSLRYILERTNTPFFMCCSGHDKWDPFFVEKLLPAFKEKDVVISYSKSRNIKMDGTMGVIYKDDYTTTHIDSPVDRYLFVLKRINVTNIIYGIWLTKVLKKCDLNTRAAFSDHIVLMHAALEGKFKQHDEVLFFGRTNREEGHGQAIRRRYSFRLEKKSVNVEKTSVFLLVIHFILESIKIPLSKRYSLSITTKLWLAMNIICIYTFKFFIIPTVSVILKKFLPKETFSKVQSIYWKKIY